MFDATAAVPKGRRIAVLRASYETQDLLRDWAKANGFDLGWSYSGWPQRSWEFDFHITLIATENAVSIPEGARWVEPVTVEVDGFEVLGGTPTLKVKEHHALSAMRAFFMTAFGAKPTFPDFKPHISVSYKWAGEPDLSTIAPPIGPLVFDYLIVGTTSETTKAKDAAMADYASVLMLDRAEIAGTRKTKDGYLVADVRAARSGVQQYRGAEVGRPELDVVNVWRPDDEVFKKDSLSSYAFKPVTVGHPTEMVTADNWKKLSVGNVGGDVARDGGFVRVPLVLMDAEAIQSVEGGLRELSMGYDVRLEFVDGVTPEGEPYQAIQRDIRINHAALVERGRAGPACRIGDQGKPDAKREREPATIGDDTMSNRNMTVDGITIPVTDQAAQVIEKLQKQIGDQSTALADAKKAIDTATDAMKTLKDQHAKELADLKAQIPTADQLEGLLDKRSGLIDAAKKISPALADSFKGKSAADVRKAVVADKLGDAAVKDKSADYIAAQFDALATIAGNGGGTDPVRDAIAGGITTKVGDADKARTEALEKQRNAWAA